MKAYGLGLLLQARAWLYGGVALLAILLCACQAPSEALERLASGHGHRLEVLGAEPFFLMLAVPRQALHASRLRLYIEGDGHAWATPTQPSLDPTPRHLLLAGIAVSDPTPAVYLGRPCQFVASPTCEQTWWTDRRFAPSVLASLGHALDALKARYGNRDFELVGYSGGAALALLLAAQRGDVAQVQTLAGNLSPRLWVQAMQLAPLTGSLDPLDYTARLAHVPQRHWVAADDRVVPAELARKWRRALGPGACIELRIVPGARHDAGLEQPWQQGRDQAIDCKERD
jgi:pimeloyl-ACP methyl ester carboxylesterase